MICTCKDLVWRRVHKSPLLNIAHKVNRYNWTTGNANNDFAKYWFADETCIYQNECPDYAYRPKGSYPDAFEVSSGSSRKINLWAAISFRGATSFVVSVN